MDGHTTHELRLHAMTFSSVSTVLLDLRPVHGALPTFSPGAHIDLFLPGALVRSYSLLNDADERHRYVIGVHLNPTSRGGSLWLHESARVGCLLTVSAPKNHFPLLESARHSLLIGGGIGITPLWCMVQRLESRGAPWTLCYSTRTRKGAALLDEIESLARRSANGKLIVHIGDESNGRRLDLAHVIASSASPGGHLYCCGPIAMLDDFLAVCQEIPKENVHVEYFAGKEPIVQDHDGFEVVLARSSARVRVGKDQTILDALQAKGIAVASSCGQGICGACETKVIDGVPDHRDLILSEAERRSNKIMMICCSGSTGKTLVLDL